jgi:hypothetical protein
MKMTLKLMFLVSEVPLRSFLEVARIGLVQLRCPLGGAIIIRFFRIPNLRRVSVCLSLSRELLALTGQAPPRPARSPGLA